MFDCHVHSSYSGDSDIPPHKACDAAINLGLSGIAFTDHLDIDFPDFDEAFNIDFDQYDVFMDRLKEEYRGRLRVLKGIEVGFQPHVFEQSDTLVRKYAFDFVISSVHIIDRLDPYRGDFFDGKTKVQAYRRYLDEILVSVKTTDNFDVLGHIGYLRRYGCYDDRSLRYSDYSDILDSIFKITIAKGKGIEVNTSGYRTGLASPIPDYDIIRRYRELGGEIICLGSDAHFVEHIGHSFDYVRDMLRQIGFRYITHYEQRVPVFDRI